MIHLVVYGQAAPAGSKTAYIKNGRAIVTDANKRARPWKDQVAAAAGAVMEGEKLLKGPLSVEIGFFQPRPKAHYGKKGVLPSAPPYPIGKPDVLKLARAVEDALTGIVWLDDSQIVSEWLFKQYGEPAKCEIRIQEVTEWMEETQSAASQDSSSGGSRSSDGPTTVSTRRQTRLFESLT